MTLPDITVTDMHTGGEPVRIITNGWPEILGDTILEKRDFVSQNHEYLRKYVMFEPRGHADMYGALIVPSNLAGADFGVLFMHNEGWSTMCGHAVIALGRYAVDQGWVERQEPVTRVAIECPCGLVMAAVTVENGKARAVSFESVPAFLFKQDHIATLTNYGIVTCDIAYGGAFYAIADAAQFGLEFGREPLRHFVDAADALTKAIQKSVKLPHPEFDELSFLYGSIFTDGGNGKNVPSKNICVFAEREVDRSPTGSGVTARLAIMHAKSKIMIGETHIFESVTGAQFTGSVIDALPDYPVSAIRAKVGGTAFYTGTAIYTHEAGDRLGEGFLLR